MPHDQVLFSRSVTSLPTHLRMDRLDTKFSWIILAIVSFIVSLETGTIKAFAVLLPDLKEHLSSQTWIIGSCISIIYGLGFVTG